MRLHLDPVGHLVEQPRADGVEDPSDEQAQLVDQPCGQE